MKLYDVLRKEKGEGERLAVREDDDYVETPLQQQSNVVFTPRRVLIIGIGLVALGGIYYAGLRFAHATVTINQRRVPFTLTNATIDIPNQQKADSGTLSFQAMVVNSTISREVYGSALTTSNTKSSGSVVFFNEYSTAKQTIKKGTTLTATNGKKYITQAAVTVPGYTTVNKKKIDGTSPSVGVLAADVGDAYNSTGTNLTVSGYPKTMYATSSAFIGGLSGIAHTLTDAEKADAITTLEAQLIEQLKRQTRAQIPADLATFPNLQQPIVDPKSFAFQGGSVRFPASMSGTMVSYLIPRAQLEQAVAAKALRNNAYPNVAIPDLDALTFNIQTAIPTDPSVVPDSITITVSGSGTVIAKVSGDAIRQRLAGQHRSAFSDDLKDIAEIDTARFHLFPFWAPRFPTNWAKIDVNPQ